MSALSEAADRFRAGERDARGLRQRVQQRVEATPGATLDYVALVDAENLEPVEHIDRPVLLALAVRFGGARLIDNVRLNGE